MSGKLYNNFKINYLKTKIFLAFSVLSFISCNKTNELQTDESKKLISDTIANASESLSAERVIQVDSIKMHAFDNLYFGENNRNNSRKFQIDNIEYGVKILKGLQDNQTYYYMLQSNSKIITKKKAEKVLKDLKKIISTKYSNTVVLNQIYYSKHPEEREKNTSSFDDRSLREFDENLIGQPYEYAGYKWDLKYKTIQIGYFIENKNRTRFSEPKPKDDDYIIYIELTSKLLQPKIENNSKNEIEKDSKKF